MRSGLEALERGLGVAEIMLALGALQRLLQSLDQSRIGSALDHGEAVVADFVGMRTECRHPSASRSPDGWRIARSAGLRERIARCIHRWRMDRSSASRDASGSCLRPVCQKLDHALGGRGHQPGKIHARASRYRRAPRPGSGRAAAGSAPAPSPIRGRWPCRRSGSDRSDRRRSDGRGSRSSRPTSPTAPRPIPRIVGLGKAEQRALR